jgi:predicted nucleotidyltransferase
MRKPNGYVLEQLFSPLVVVTTPAHAELQALGRRCVTRQHVRHYTGFAGTQWRLFAKGTPPRVKPLLYVYRVLLTGIHLLRTGEVQADLSVLNETARLPHVDALVTQKRSGTEQGVLPAAELPFHQREYERLLAELHAAPAAAFTAPSAHCRSRRAVRRRRTASAAGCPAVPSRPGRRCSPT